MFKLKKDGSQIIKYKARVMVKECARKKGTDLSEIFSLAVKMRSIRVVLGLVTSLDLELEQLHVKIAFLHGDM